MPFFAKRSEDAEIELVKEQEKRFQLSVRRDRMLGIWAGEMLGLAGEALEAYADRIVKAALRGPNGALIAISDDFRQSRMTLATLDLPLKAEECLVAARAVAKAA